MFWVTNFESGTIDFWRFGTSGQRSDGPGSDIELRQTAYFLKFLGQEG
jgi:hypothetical protein